MWTAFITPIRGEDVDDDLKTRIIEDLEGQNIDALRSIEVDVLDGTVLLSGVVSLYHHKQVAQEVWKRVPGILGVQNTIEVSRKLAHGQLTITAKVIVPLNED